MTRKLIAAAAVIAAMLACTKNEQPESGSTTNEGFQKGQQVTLTVKAGDPSTRVSSALNDDGKNVDFKWEEGDKVKVTVDGYPDDPAVFTLSSGAGTPTATFTGKMPADGSKYTVQYPVDDPDITTQAYSSTEIIPHDKMKFIGEGEYNVYAHTEPLTAQNAALKLNLYGKSKTISKIVVTNTTSSIKYTLNCTNAVTLGTTAESATPFLIVVPADTYNFSVEVITEDSTTIPESENIIKGLFTVASNSTTISTSSPQTFTGGKVLNMEAKVISPTKVCFSKGNLYYDNAVSPAVFKFEDTQYSYHQRTSASTGYFRWAENSGNLENDITSAINTSTATLVGTTDDVLFTNATQTTPRADFTVAGQTGVWRTLSNLEMYYILFTRKVNGGKGIGYSCVLAKINSDSSNEWGVIIFPDNYSSETSGTSYTASEWATMQDAGCVFLRGLTIPDLPTYLDLAGYYWLSNSYPSWDMAYFLGFSYYSLSCSSGNSRKWGSSIRLVCDAQ